jgi:hypothetical protein
MVLADLDVATYEPTEKKVAINVRVPLSTKATMDDLVRLWRLYAEARGDEVDVNDLSYVVRRLLRVGGDQAFGEFGGRPKDEAGWKAIEAVIGKAVKKSR